MTLPIAQDQPVVVPRRMTVGRKISLGFAIVLTLHVSIAVLSHQGLTKADRDRERINALREQVALFYEIDRVVGDVRHNVALFTQDGISGPEHRAVELLDYLAGLLDKAESVPLRENEAASVMAMRRHIDTHREILAMVVSDRAHRRRLLDIDLTDHLNDLYRRLDTLGGRGESDGLAATVKAVLRRSDLSVMRFVNDPDSMHVRGALAHLKDADRLLSERAAYAVGEEARELAQIDALMAETRECLIELVQTTRGYLHLTNVVLAGEEQEFLYHARSIQEGHAECARLLSTSMIAESTRYQHASNWFSLATIVLGVLAAWLIQHDIAPPLQTISAAFERLSRGEECGVIPGADRCDELGELAAAAQVFNEQAAETTRLLHVSESAKAELNVLNQRLAEQTAIAERMATEATAATQSKSEFLANMSHEIRTPMAAILGFTSILDGCDDPALQRDAVKTIRRNGEHLLNVINDILDLSKVEAGKLTVSVRPIDPNQLLKDTIDLIRVKADAAGVELRLAFEASLPHRIDTDETRVRQILLNLIGNAIKFAEAGRVDVSAGISRAGDSEMLSIDIIDTGIGISDEHQALLFAPFSQADNSMRRDFGGTGLGLVISKRLAEMLGGDVVLVDSAPGKGSHFRLTVEASPVQDHPVALATETPPAGASASAPAPEGEPSATPLAGRRVLVAEDGPDNQRIVTFFLERAGAQVHLVENGELAMQLLIGDSPQESGFDCVLMDMQMPVMDGYESTKRLRAAGYRGPIIALTAHAMESDRRLCLDAGCDDYHAKPFEADKLVATVAMWSAPVGATC